MKKQDNPLYKNMTEDQRGILDLLQDFYDATKDSGGVFASPFYRPDISGIDIFGLQSADMNRTVDMLSSSLLKKTIDSAVAAEFSGIMSQASSKKQKQQISSLINSVRGLPGGNALALKLSGLGGTQEFFRYAGQLGNSIASASGSGVYADILNPSGLGKNVSDAVMLQNMAYGMAVNDSTGTINMDYTHGLSIEQIGKLSARALSNRKMYYDENGNSYAKIGESPISNESFKQSFKELTDKVNEAVAAFAPLCGSVESATDMLDEMSGADGNMFNMSKYDQNRYLDRATMQAYAMQAVGASAGISPQQMYAISQGFMQSFASRRDLGLSQSNLLAGYGGSYREISNLMAINMADYKAKHPNATGMQLYSYQQGISNKINNYLGSGIDNFSAVVADMTRTGGIEEKDYNRYLTLLREGEGEGAVAFITGNYGNNAIKRAMNPADVAISKKNSSELYNQSLSAGAEGQASQKTSIDRNIEAGNIINNAVSLLSSISPDSKNQYSNEALTKDAYKYILSEKGIASLITWNPDANRNSMKRIADSFNSGKITSEEAGIKLQEAGVRKNYLDRAVDLNKLNSLNSQIASAMSDNDNAKKYDDILNSPDFLHKFGISQDDMTNAANGKTGMNAVLAKSRFAAEKSGRYPVSVLTEDLKMSGEAANSLLGLGVLDKNIYEGINRAIGVSEYTNKKNEAEARRFDSPIWFQDIYKKYNDEDRSAILLNLQREGKITFGTSTPRSFLAKKFRMDLHPESNKKLDEAERAYKDVIEKGGRQVDAVTAARLKLKAHSSPGSYEASDAEAERRGQIHDLWIKSTAKAFTGADGNYISGITDRIVLDVAEAIDSGSGGSDRALSILKNVKTKDSSTKILGKILNIRNKMVDDLAVPTENSSEPLTDEQRRRVAILNEASSASAHPDTKNTDGSAEGAMASAIANSATFHGFGPQSESQYAGQWSGIAKFTKRYTDRVLKIFVPNSTDRLKTVGSENRTAPEAAGAHSDSGSNENTALLRQLVEVMRTFVTKYDNNS